VTAISAVDELRGDAHAGADLPNASFQDEGNLRSWLTCCTFTGLPL
jgi:hypothetical protein